jgi:hypothetical protein
MSELPIVTPGEIIGSQHINDIMLRTVQRYANAADRDTETPTPVTGELAYLEDTGEMQVYNGSAWVAPNIGIYANRYVLLVAPDQEINGEVTFVNGRSVAVVVQSGVGDNNASHAAIAFTSDAPSRPAVIQGYRGSSSQQMGLNFSSYDNGQVLALSVDPDGRVWVRVGASIGTKAVRNINYGAGPPSPTEGDIWFGTDRKVQYWTRSTWFNMGYLSTGP